jgi:hypothetical protein
MSTSSIDVCYSLAPPLLLVVAACGAVLLPDGAGNDFTVCCWRGIDIFAMTFSSSQNQSVWINEDFHFVPLQRLLCIYVFSVRTRLIITDQVLRALPERCYCCMVRKHESANIVHSTFMELEVMCNERLCILCRFFWYR